jgi:ADP-ribose 1''-phosphate phosphatase
MIIYKKGSLFDAPKGSILVHSVSTKGVWGSGIAKEFKRKFPKSFKNYQNALVSCDYANISRIGKGFILPWEKDYYIACLVTSNGYGKFKDSKELILRYTYSALSEFLNYKREEENLDRPIHSNKFNSGLFGVPWKETEKILLEVMKETGYNKTWTVWSL